MRLSTLAATALALLSGSCSPATVQAGLIPQNWERADPTMQMCNGHAELCNRSYGNITFFGSHDSFAYSRDPLALAADQNVDIPTQLGLGVRMLQAQSHMNELDGEIHFCHTSCLLFDGGKVVDYLTTVKSFLDAHPNEVLTFIFTNPEGLNLTSVWAPAFEASGMDKLAFIPPTPGQPVKQSEWPTLGEMIESGRRVVVFLDAGADTPTGGVPYLLPEFQMIWEPPFSQTDPAFPCRVDRIRGPLSTEEHMYMLNHNLNTALFGDEDLLVPAYREAAITNSVTSILANANNCTPLAGGRAPSFLLLDFVDVGEGLQAANLLNGFPANGTMPGGGGKNGAVGRSVGIGTGWLGMVVAVVLLVLG